MFNNMVLILLGEEDYIPYLESSTKLVCSNPSVFLFQGITNLSLLNMLNCDSWTSEVGTFIAVYSTGYGLIGRNMLGIASITRTLLKHIHVLLVERLSDHFECTLYSWV